MSSSTELEIARIRRIELEVAIAAPIDRVWHCLTREIGLWWPSTHFAQSDSKAYKLEPWVGGRMFEDSEAGNAVLWYTVIRIEAPNVIEFAGHTSPKWGGPSTSILTLTLDPSETGTRLQLSDASFGHVTEDQGTEEGWRSLQTHFKAYVESGMGGPPMRISGGSPE